MMPRVFLGAVVVTAALLGPSGVAHARPLAMMAEAECCDACIGKVSATPYNYDPLIYAECIDKSEGTRICCFECGSLGDPSYGDAVSYADDGTTPMAKAGTWITLQWSSVSNVTYIQLKTNQKKTLTPTVGDAKAKVESNGYFMMCANSPGSLVFRGWGDDTCREASLEHTITIEKGDDGATCDANAPDTPAPNPKKSDDPDIADCNLSRAAIKDVDGVKQCVCASDYSGPPSCDGMPVWKWLITIGGGVAALLSIAISVRAFMKSREKKKAQEDDDPEMMPPRAKDDVETIRIGGNAPDASPPSQHTAYRRDTGDRSPPENIGGVGYYDNAGYQPHKEQQAGYPPQNQQQPGYPPQNQHQAPYQPNNQSAYPRASDDGMYKGNDREFSL